MRPRGTVGMSSTSSGRQMVPNVRDNPSEQCPTCGRRRPGRPRGTTPVQNIMDALIGGMKVTTVAQKFAVSRASVYRILTQLPTTSQNLTFETNETTLKRRARASKELQITVTQGHLKKPTRKATSFTSGSDTKFTSRSDTKSRSQMVPAGSEKFSFENMRKHKATGLSAE
jgi:hypothetical protein